MSSNLFLSVCFWACEYVCACVSFNWVSRLPQTANLKLVSSVFLYDIYFWKQNFQNWISKHFMLTWLAAVPRNKSIKTIVSVNEIMILRQHCLFSRIKCIQRLNLVNSFGEMWCFRIGTVFFQIENQQQIVIAAQWGVCSSNYFTLFHFIFIFKGTTMAYFQCVPPAVVEFHSIPINNKTDSMYNQNKRRKKT